MKKLIFGSLLAICFGFAPQANAQGFCCAPQYDSCCCPQDDFSGLYVGGNVGVITHLAFRNDLDGFTTGGSPAGFTSSDTNVTAGVILGYDWQCCNTVLGIVADWNWVNTDRKIRALPNSTSNYHKHELDWFTTIRARAGVSLCDVLFYLTGGAAVTRTNAAWFNDPDRFHHERTRWGWVGGLGAEFKLWCNFSLGAELLHIHFSNHTRTFTSSAGTPFSFTNSDSAWIGRIILNYRFGDLCCLF